MAKEEGTIIKPSKMEAYDEEGNVLGGPNQSRTYVWITGQSLRLNGVYYIVIILQTKT